MTKKPDTPKHVTPTPPSLGYGVGLRASHFQYVLNNDVAVDWFEIISENFMDSAGWPKEVITQLAERFTLIPHGVSLSIGSLDPINKRYLQRLAELIELCDAPWFSDHLCWSSFGSHNSHDLLPLPYTKESLLHLCSRIQEVQDTIRRPFILENPSSYLSFSESTYSEWEFLAELCKRTGCGLLLDLNNIYVCERNHGWPAQDYLKALKPEWIWQVHIAGHSDYGTHCIDTHIGPIPKPVWELYLQATKLFGSLNTLVEWDQEIPEFQVLEQELATARSIAANGYLPEYLYEQDHCKIHTDSVEALSHPINFMINKVAQ